MSFHLCCIEVVRRRVEGLDKILQITTRGSTGLRIFDDNDNCNGNGIGKSGLNEFIIWLFFLRIKVWFINVEVLLWRIYNKGYKELKGVAVQ